MSLMDLFPRTDKVRKTTEKPIDIFSHTDAGLRRTSYQLAPCGNRWFTVKEIACLREFAAFLEEYEPVFLAKENVH